MDDFSTNRHETQAASPPTRYSDLSFQDGNVAVVAGPGYFLVHKGLLCRHSIPLQQATKNLDSRVQIEGRPVLYLDDSPQDMQYFLAALYDGLGLLGINNDVQGFPRIDALLRLTTKYQVNHIRSCLLHELQRTHWPTQLAQWEMREAEATDPNGHYDARQFYPHPISVINLARKINALELLPSAFYDLSRYTVSETASGYTDACNIHHRLSQSDLMHLLRGREHASRFLSTFIVNELEGRSPAANCVHAHGEDGAHRRSCQAAFENITFEILRDVNGVTHRSSDPLFTIVDAELMQTREDSHGHSSVVRACEFCRTEFGHVVDHAREEFWSKLPGWFGIELPADVWV